MQKVTITAKGYENLRGLVVRTDATGAYIQIQRSTDLAPRVIRFNDDAIKGEVERMPEPVGITLTEMVKVAAKELGITQKAARALYTRGSGLDGSIGPIKFEMHGTLNENGIKVYRLYRL